MAGGTPLDAALLDRRQPVMIGEPPREVFVHTPEDILLQKLRWFRLGGETSDRQWGATFEIPAGPTTPLRSYDVGPDGRFIMTRPMGDPEPPFTQMEVVLNFAEELRRRVPAQR